MRRIVLALSALALVLAAAPLAAYTIYTKGGGKIIVKEKYEVRGDQAYFVQLNGTAGVLPLAEIDVARTEEANQQDYGSAVVIEGGRAQALPNASSRQQPEEEKRLQDLIQERSAGVRDLPEIRRQEAAEAVRLPRTAAGAVDLVGLPRKPYSDEAVTTELRSFLQSQGLDTARVYQGTAAGRPLVEIPASTEAAVFRALTVSASALLHLGDRVNALELLMLTPTQQRGGQFVLTPEQAAGLAARQVEPAAFFLAHVQF